MQKFFFIIIALISGSNALAGDYNYLAPKGIFHGAPAAGPVAPPGTGFTGVSFYITGPAYSLDIGGRESSIIAGFPSKVGILREGSVIVSCHVNSSGKIDASSCESAYGLNSPSASSPDGSMVAVTVNYPPDMPVGGNINVTPFMEFPGADTTMSISTQSDNGNSFGPVKLVMSKFATSVKSPCSVSCSGNGNDIGGATFDITVPALEPMSDSLSVTGSNYNLTCSSVLPQPCIATGEFDIKTAVPAIFTVRNNSEFCGANPVSTEMYNITEGVSITGDYRTKSASVEKFRLTYTITPDVNAIAGHTCEVVSILSISTI